MARGQSASLTEREAEIMAVIWRLGGATAEAIRAGMVAPPQDSTVRTLLRVLEGKGYVAHERVGKAFRYSARIDQRGAQGRAIGSLLARFFGGSAEDLVLRLIEEERITPAQLAELQREGGRGSDQDRPARGPNREE